MLIESYVLVECEAKNCIYNINGECIGPVGDKKLHSITLKIAKDGSLKCSEYIEEREVD